MIIKDFLVSFKDNNNNILYLKIKYSNKLYTIKFYMSCPYQYHSYTSKNINDLEYNIFFKNLQNTIDDINKFDSFQDLFNFIKKTY